MSDLRILLWPSLTVACAGFIVWHVVEGNYLSAALAVIATFICATFAWIDHEERHDDDG